MLGFLFFYTRDEKPFTEEQLIYDLIWLDVWGMACIAFAVLIWRSSVDRSLRQVLLLGLLSVGLWMVMRLMFNGTPFPENSFWGDQKFRMAMILKFMEFGFGVDYYYKGLPAFYPPVYYLVLSILGKIGGIPAYALQNVGSQGIALIGTPLLYILWRRVVDPLPALCITAAHVLYTSATHPFLTGVPHAWLGNSFFIPWWLHWVETIRARHRSWQWYLAGGSIGALLFATYFYPFFIAVPLLAFRIARKTFEKNSTIDATWVAVRPAIVNMILSALFSSPYWFPPLLSVLMIGGDRSRGEWHHAEAPGTDFIGFSWSAVLFILGTLFLIRQSRKPLYRALVTMSTAVVIFFMLGSFLGAVDYSVNLVKTREFMHYLFGPAVGITAAIFIRWGRSQIRVRSMLTGAAVVGLTLAIVDWSTNASGDYVRKARSATVPTWGLDSLAMQQRAGAVFLAGNEELFSFYPVYSFVAMNEHYSHPASQFIKRYEFLWLLQLVDDPTLMAISLRSNVYDAVDYFLPYFNQQTRRPELFASLSHYPDKLATQTLSYAPAAFADTTCFQPQERSWLLKVQDQPSQLDGSAPTGLSSSTGSRKATFVHALIASHLSTDGRKHFVTRWNDRSGTIDLPAVIAAHHALNDRITLLGVAATIDTIGINLQTAFLANRDILPDQKLSLVVRSNSPAGQITTVIKMIDPQDWKTGQINIFSTQLPRELKGQEYRILLLSETNEIGIAFRDLLQ